MRRTRSGGVLLLVLFIAACASAPPTLSPKGVAAFNALRVVRALDVVRDTAIDAHAQGLITTVHTHRIVSWHEASLRTIKAVPEGWKSTVLAGLDALKQEIPQHEWGRIALYVDLLRTVIQEVVP